MNEKNYPTSPIWFDWLFILFAGIWTIGAFVDGWAHTHLTTELETFFTPWHAVFYLGIFLTTATLFIQAVINLRRGFTIRNFLPKEYLFSMIGVIVALIAGIGDLIWHTLFGIEVGIEALLSPTHLLLAIGGAIAVSGPFHAIWYRNKEHPRHKIPTVLSAAFFFSVIMFMLQFLHPFNFPWMTESFLLENPIDFNYGAGLGIANIIIFSGVFVGLILASLRHWVFPFGSFTMILVFNVAAITLMHGKYLELIYSAFVAGLIIDILYVVLKLQIKDGHIRLFSFLVPVIIFSLYFLTLSLTDKILWSMHMWTGAIVISGIIGFIMSYLVISPESRNWKG